jgi:proteasome accessory factor A
VVSPAQVDEAAGTPPATTRARLRGAFVAAAQRQQRDFTVDWSHLRLTDAAQRTVVCQDPFLAQDLRVDRLIASMAG